MSYRYLKSIIITSSILFSAVCSLNYLVNPFNMFNIERVKGLNEIKPSASKRVRIFKKYQPLYIKPKTLILGTSRVEMGFETTHESLDLYRPVYNLGLPGMSMTGQLSYAQNIIDKLNVKTVIIAIDFTNFLAKPNNSDFKGLSLDVNELEDKLSSLLSLDALKSSIVTMLNQNEFSSDRTPNGFNPGNEYLSIIKYEGQSSLFEDSLEILHSYFEREYKLFEENNYEYLKAGPLKLAELQANKNSYLSILRRKIDKWSSSGIDIKLFIQPYHRTYYTEINNSGLSGLFENWKKLMNDQFSPKYDFCDFTELGYNMSDEKITDKNELKYFWEPGHYKKELGYIMLPKILKGCN